MKVGDLVRPKSRLEGWDSGTESWLGVVTKRAGHGRGAYVVVYWDDCFLAEEEYIRDLEVINATR